MPERKRGEEPFDEFDAAELEVTPLDQPNAVPRRGWSERRANGRLLAVLLAWLIFVDVAGTAPKDLVQRNLDVPVVVDDGYVNGRVARLTDRLVDQYHREQQAGDGTFQLSVFDGAAVLTRTVRAGELGYQVIINFNAEDQLTPDRVTGIRVVGLKYNNNGRLDFTWSYLRLTHDPKGWRIASSNYDNGDLRRGAELVQGMPAPLPAEDLNDSLTERDVALAFRFADYIEAAAEKAANPGAPSIEDQLDNS